jgi:hypothetical protein
MAWGRPLWSLLRRNRGVLARQPEVLALDHDPSAPAPWNKISQPEVALRAGRRHVGRQGKSDGQRVVCLFGEWLGLSLGSHCFTSSRSRPPAQRFPEMRWRTSIAALDSRQPHPNSHQVTSGNPCYGQGQVGNSSGRSKRHPPPYVSHRCLRRVIEGARTQRIGSTCPMIAQPNDRCLTPSPRQSGEHHTRFLPAYVTSTAYIARCLQ